MTNRPVKRRLAAVLAADVAGYTRLVEADTDGTVAAWRSARDDVIDPLVTRHAGRIVKLTGDGFLVEFPNVQDAVECAVALQEGLADNPLSFRMGVNLGDIVDDDRDIHGEGVNIAARLESLAPPRGICISGLVFESVRNRIDLIYEDLGEKTVKHVSAPVRVYAIRLKDGPIVPAAAEPTNDDRSIAVLPFTNTTGGEEQSYLADGLTEDLIIDLSKISGLRVTARNSAFAFKGQSGDVRDIGRKLGVKHVLEGSVRRMADRVRINAQLVDATSGSNLWAERYDGPFDDIFSLQDEIMAKIVAALAVRLTSAERERAGRRPTTSTAAYDQYLKGRSEYYRYTPVHLARAQTHFEEAIRLDPAYADAYGYLSYCRTSTYVFAWPGADPTLDRALELAEKALALDDTSPVAHSRLGWVLGFLGRFDAAVANFEKAAAIAPRSAEVFYAFGETMNRAGDPERALPLIEKAFSIDTFVPPGWDFAKAHSFVLMRRYEEAQDNFRTVLDRVPSFVPARVQRARACVEMDRQDDAEREVAAIREIAPNYTLRNAMRMFPYPGEEERRRLVEALRTAGLPE